MTNDHRIALGSVPRALAVLLAAAMLIAAAPLAGTAFADPPESYTGTIEVNDGSDGLVPSVRHAGANSLETAGLIAPATSARLTEIAPDVVYVAGGEASLPESITEQVAEAIPDDSTVEQVAGAERQSASMGFAELGHEEFGFVADHAKHRQRP